MSTVEQRTSALAKAQAIRTMQGRLKASLRSGEVSLADALEDPVARDMVWWRLVQALKGWSHARVMQLAIDLAQQGTPIDPQRRVRMLTVRQRLALIDAVCKPKHVAKPGLTVPGMGCIRCKIRLLEPATLCGFCIGELAEEEGIAA